MRHKKLYFFFHRKPKAIPQQRDSSVQLNKNTLYEL
jgi:hypothetical protein